MKMKIVKFVIEVTALVVTLTTLITSIIAWYIVIDNVNDMNFNILQIDSMVTLYEANDNNFNGVPNLQSSENIDKYYNAYQEEGRVVGYVGYTNKYHTENYSFNYLDQRYALSADSSANLLNTITLTNVAPSKIYTYKFEITNYSGLNNDLTFGFDAEAGYTPVPNSLKDFDVRIGIVGSDATVNFCDWTNFCTENSGTYSYSNFNLNPLSETMSIEATTGDLSVGRLDLWLQIRANSSSTQNFAELILPQYRITLSCEVADE